MGLGNKFWVYSKTQDRHMEKLSKHKKCLNLGTGISERLHTRDLQTI